ncbi:hypothetical protein [Agromyces sp. Marseille-Q5079]|uniref:hypothetical protein n=1 Tax=Agromyces sp. Marseille-Q5079 TaxID=3439059 RepID=UPI003D9C7D63
MPHLQLDAARLSNDGTALFSIAQSVSSAVRACESALGGTGGMAGDDESAEVFAHGQDGEPGYDQYSVDVMKSALGMANALRIVDAALGNTGRAYDGAQLVGAFKPAASSGIPEETPSIVPPSASVPTSLGKGPEGPLGEFGDFLKDALAMLGVMLPSADRGKLSNAESAWSELSGAMTRAQSRVDGAFTSVSSMTLPQKSSMLSCQRSLGSSFGKVADSADSMAGFARGMIDAVDKAWEEIGWFIAQMAVEIAIEIGVGALLGMVTFGAGAAAMAAKIMLTVTRWAIKIATLCRKLRTLIMMALRAARMAIRGGIRVARESISAGLASGITTVSFNSVRGALDPNYQPQNVLNAALSAAAGGATGGTFSGAAGRLTSSVPSGGMQQVTHFAAEVGGGAIDGLGEGLAGSALSGQAFEPLSAMAAGALLGGALSGRPGGAHSPSSPSAPSAPGGSSSPVALHDIDTSGVPSGTGTNANGGTPGGSGAVGISNDAPTTGSGGGGSSTSGGGGQVDVSNDAPTPSAGGPDVAGAGDGGGSVDLPGAVDSGGVDLRDGSTANVPAADAPTADAPAADAPNADAPPAEAPTAAGALSADVPTQGADVPAADASTHADASAADAPTDTDAPTHAEAPTPDAPKTDAPAHSGTPTPDAPAEPSPSSAPPEAYLVDSGGAPASDVSPHTVTLADGTTHDVRSSRAQIAASPDAEAAVEAAAAREGLSIQEAHDLIYKTPVDQLTPDQAQALVRIRDSVPPIRDGETMQKVLAIKHEQGMFDPNNDFRAEVSGFVARAADTQRLETPDDLLHGIGLDYGLDATGKPTANHDFMNPDGSAKPMLAVRFEKTAEIDPQVPMKHLGDQAGEPDRYHPGKMDAPGGLNPYLGNGFVGKGGKEIVPEYHLENKVENAFRPGSELWRVEPDGTETLIGVFSGGVWVRVV